MTCSLPDCCYLGLKPAGLQDRAVSYLAPSFQRQDVEFMIRFFYCLLRTSAQCLLVCPVAPFLCCLTRQQAEGSGAACAAVYSSGNSPTSSHELLPPRPFAPYSWHLPHLTCQRHVVHMLSKVLQWHGNLSFLFVCDCAALQIDYKSIAFRAWAVDVA